MARPDRSVGALPPERAFVVQFSGDTRFAEATVVGRVEHIHSGRTTHFTRMDQLVAFLDELLSEGTPRWPSPGDEHSKEEKR